MKACSAGFRVFELRPLDVDVYKEHSCKEKFEEDWKEERLLASFASLELKCIKSSSAAEVCLEKNADTAMVPCGHLCVCQGCVRSVMAGERLCPVCRAEATPMQIYRS